jgi:hypothetical protein
MGLAGFGSLLGGLDQHSDTERRSIPDAATVQFLLGRLWHNTGDVEKSVDAYVAALKLNPFSWEAFTGLCDTGISAMLCFADWSADAGLRCKPAA